TVLITGANVGLGLEAAHRITRLGPARVLLADIEKPTGRPEVCEVWEVKLLSHASVLAFGECISKLPNLDAAILNAAIATSEFGTAE
ncbi:uncharacterized protein N7479_003848, partial [Penicillium vulpinum]|uniref:uncharacterized protein n=1 Tax=Penicillium vulpinum TaxID=29845 RepID=UPI0025474DF6